MTTVPAGRGLLVTDDRTHTSDDRTREREDEPTWTSVANPRRTRRS